MPKENKLSCYVKLPGETLKSFNEFTEIRDLPPSERNLVNVAKKHLADKEIIESHSDYPKELKKEHNRLLKLSQKWCWFERFTLYDYDQQVEWLQKRKDTFYEYNTVLLDVIKGEIKYCNNLLADLINDTATKQNGESYSVNTKIKMLKDITDIIRTCHDLLCNLCGMPREITRQEFEGLIDGIIDVKGTVTNDVSFDEEMEKYVDFFKQIEQPTESTDNKDSL